MCAQRRVAFFAGQNDNYGPVCDTRDFACDSVVTNIGSGYSPSSGRFTAPVAATYQFNVTISAQETHRAAFMLMNNNSKVMTVWAKSIPNWATSSSSAILSLNAGDQVWLQIVGDASYVYGDMYTLFSGLLIFEN